ncbi:hypothetical protein AQ505_05990 [Pedobacter sp. PACM 27299]|uniref:HIT family protein n=1 Tax=Pedobacter sp. PACM 27299 TaxID=1727164 RepID=UPI00070616F6|nr:HIT family protein [Pedobacter sp. PACM 27299]ALL05085.1 hypothetical protein AQ505_05990 [Pedobacter sp. PACM 27299]
MENEFGKLTNGHGIKIKNLMEQEDCLFCKIASREIFSWTIWEDEDHLAFLTPFPNTPGFTVVATKLHLDSDVLQLPQDKLFSLISAGKEVSKILNAKLSTKRTALIAEGMGVNHAHIKLIPLFGIPEGEWKPINSSLAVTFETYPGYISSHDGPRASDDEMNRIFKLLKTSKVK